MVELMEIIELMVELPDETFQEAIVNLRGNKSLSKDFVELLIDFTSDERDKNKTIPIRLASKEIVLLQGVPCKLIIWCSDSKNKKKRRLIT